MNDHMKKDYNVASQLALRVALHTMKKRCLTLEQKLSSVEKENQKLQSRISSEHSCNSCHQIPATPHGSLEMTNLRAKVAELTEQKVQLSDHINMVASENRKLWSRLLQISKDQDTAVVTTKDGESSPSQLSTGDELDCQDETNQTLIRSKTFTLHSPNPKLRLKPVFLESNDNSSLDEVLLVETSDDDQNMNSEENSDIRETELGFAYLNINGSLDDEFNAEAKKCFEGLHKLRLEALEQQVDITMAYTTLENRFVLQGCAECAAKACKPEMVDKSLATEDSFTESANYASDSSDLARQDEEEKLSLSDLGEASKICPLCGVMFSSCASFESFRDHVECHFVEESPTVEHNFELISHTVGDF